MKKYLTVTLVLAALCSVLYATAQFGDRLIYKGQTYEIFTNPLESFFNNEHPRPENLFKYSCTACWRGYIATWKIEEGRLWLVKAIEGSCDINAAEIDLSGVFGKKLPVEATWYSGVLRVPQGELLDYVHMGYESVYEKELLITIQKGKVIKEETIDNKKKE